jgi:hypothetical protein
LRVSEHFQDSELGWELGGDAHIDALLQLFCNNVLEPIRSKFGAVRITCGNRTPEHNAAVGGVATSQHIWSPEHVAVDFQVVKLVGQTEFTPPTLQEVFDWIRLESGLPFDQVILERGGCPDSEADDCIHVSYTLHPRRQAKVGETHGKDKHYTAAEVKGGGPTLSNIQILGES